YFTNSGSESNDLALRLARIATESEETIVLDGAYHGHVSSLIEISPYKHNGKGGDGPPSFVHTVPMPDMFRGKYRGEKALKGYIDELKVILDTISKQGKQVSAFIVESIMGCGGQLILPQNFLKQSFELVRSAGGICIADEVQVGFGRVGTNFWGFEMAGVIPDIVTMGKSMGNGHPLSALVTTKEIADKFNNGMEYFNSFGGNPVSCAIGNAVLDVIKEEGMQQRALKVGSYLINEIKSLQSKYPIIGDVRGAGLFIGIELIRDIENLEPAAIEADKIINQMKDQKILLSTDGPDHNVIKIKPPMVFNKDNADEFLLKLSHVLANIDYEK
ncbi:MAG: aminotransferase class III-fold pyridoxal phosphate-dependent enzyme, partial [Candidatus Neomarinimicrobiota bacterium]|nr:aminotransferase class III-fold pyridoxal phosphate-dependent enzyme [Candidatus Neomarinimicrobiota bacterium]